MSDLVRELLIVGGAFSAICLLVAAPTLWVMFIDFLADRSKL